MKLRLRSYLAKIKNNVQQHLDDPWEKNFILALIVSVGIIIFLIYTRQADLLIVVGGMATFLIGVIGMNAPRDTWMHEIAPELIGISIGVIAIDQLYQIRVNEYDRQSVIRQLGSPSNDFALEAVRIARYEGWLVDGSLERVNLYQANLVDANLMGANLFGAHLFGANLERAYLRDANLADANLGFANLADASLGGADLAGAILRNADLAGASLGDARYSDDTVWPEGFDPVAAGAILVE